MKNLRGIRKAAVNALGPVEKAHQPDRNGSSPFGKYFWTLRDPQTVIDMVDEIERLRKAEAKLAKYKRCDECSRVSFDHDDVYHHHGEGE